MTHNFADYHIPVNADIPEIEVVLVNEHGTEVPPPGVKGVGEIGVVGTAAAVAKQFITPPASGCARCRLRWTSCLGRRRVWMAHQAQVRPRGVMHNTKYFDPNRHSTWLECFFDLIFVVTIDDVTHLLSHTHEGHLDPLQFWKFVLIFIPLWWIWASHTMYANRFDTDDRKHRLATLLIMFLLIVISGLIGQRFLFSVEAIIICYAGSKYIIAAMYFVSQHRHKESVELTRAVSWVIVAGTTISLASILFPAPRQYVVFYLGILFDLLAFIFFLQRRLQVIPVHTEHLIERVGLLTIIILGESVSSLSIGLANISWTAERLLSAATGFVMISSIWWVYFDSFHLLSKQKLTTGHSVLYSHFFVFIGLSILASLIRHAILDDMALSDFRVLSVIGAVCFFIGKQYAYFMERPELRPQLVVNTLVVFVLSGFALLLPGTGYVLLGLTCAVICYAFLSLKYLTLSHAPHPRLRGDARSSR